MYTEALCKYLSIRPRSLAASQPRDELASCDDVVRTDRIGLLLGGKRDDAEKYFDT